MPRSKPPKLPAGFVHPPNTYSLTPFWFWNDRLEEEEIIRQIDAFTERGIYGFVLHPRVGLPEDCGWMSPRLLGFMRVAIDHAARRRMQVILYDEGMYPSGSCAGQVVAENSEFACRGLVLLDREPADLPDGQHIVARCSRAEGTSVWVIDRPIGSWIRGLHYTADDSTRSLDPWPARATPESRPPAADLLNPDAVACFIRLTYDRYHHHFEDHFGKTITAIFTDEPMVLGRGNPCDARPGTTDILSHVNAFLGYDFTPHLPALWHDDEPDAERHRDNYRRAIRHRLDTTYYRPLRNWCADHRVALTGHPANPDDLGHLRYFHWPGQDAILDFVYPGERAVSRLESTQAKAAASVAVHYRRQRNANEFMGAYGHDVPVSLYRFVAYWLIVRGCNLLIPHAFFYSTRGPRIDECPPQLGPHGPWWDDAELTAFHVACQRLSWLNALAHPCVHVALICPENDVPVRLSRRLFEAQIDFHYLDERHLHGDAHVKADGVHLADMHYHAVVAIAPSLSSTAINALGSLDRSRTWLLDHESSGPDIASLRAALPPHPRTSEPQPWLRLREVRLANNDWLFTFNEGLEPIATNLEFHRPGSIARIDIAKGRLIEAGLSDRVALHLEPGELALFLQGTRRSLTGVAWVARQLVRGLADVA
ncbi:MAG: hypothetical protein AAFY08_14290 [Planctomycetota bacterium]